MNFNVNRPASLGQIAALYNQRGVTPDQVDSDLMMNAPQGYSYIQQQARAQGINNPAEYFRQKQLATQMANTPTYQMQEDARMRRANALEAAQTAEQQHLATARAAYMEKQYPIPTIGTQPEFSPMEQQDMTSRGITNPMEYLVRRRLALSGAGAQAGKYMQSLPDMMQHLPKTGELFNNTQFKNMAARNPELASQFFQGMTGSNLDNYTKVNTANQLAMTKAGVEDLHDALAKQHARINEAGEVEWSKMRFDEVSNKMVPTGVFGPGDIFQKSREKYLGNIDSDIIEMQQLAARKAREGRAAGARAGTGFAGLQNPARPVDAAQQRALATGNAYTPIESHDEYAPYMVPKMAEPTFAEGYRGVYNQYQHLLSSMGVKPEYYGSEAPLQLNNEALSFMTTPTYKAWARNNPAKARQRLLELQEGRDVRNTPLMGSDPLQGSYSNF